MSTNYNWIDGIQHSDVADMVMSSYFHETEKNIEGEWTFQKWLESIDRDTLAMLESYMKNLDERYEIDEEESADMMALTIMVLGREGAFDENDEEEYMRDLVEEKIPELFGMVVMEGLRRKEAVEIRGSGKLSCEDIKYRLTSKGKELQERIMEEGKGKNNSVINGVLATLLPNQNN